LKILQVCKKFPYPLTDGERIAVFQSGKGLYEAGARVSVAAINTKKHYTNPQSVPEAIQKRYPIHSVIVDTEPRVAGFIFSYLSGSSYNMDRFHRASFTRLLSQLLTEQSFEIIQLEGAYLIPYIECIRQHTHARIVLRSHNIEHRIWQRNADFATSPLRKRLYRYFARRMERVERRALPKLDALVPISSADAAWYREQGYIGPMHISMTGFDEPKALNKQINRELRLYSVGSADWIPNIEGLRWFIEHVWTRLMDEAVPVTLHLSNAGLKKDFFAVKGITWYEQINDMQSFIADKDVLVVPLFSGSGIRIKIPEAMNQHKAVLATPIGAEGLDLIEGRDIILANTADAFVQSIRRLHEDRALLETMASSAYHTCRKRFDNRILATELLQFYNSL
jgi:hypothetical protein